MLNLPACGSVSVALDIAAPGILNTARSATIAVDEFVASASAYSAASATALTSFGQSCTGSHPSASDTAYALPLDCSHLSVTRK